MEKMEMLSTTLDVAREAGWIATMRTSQKSIRKVLVQALQKVGVSGEWLKTKQARILIAALAPMIVFGIVWAAPIKPENKTRMFGYLKRAIVLQLAKILGDSMSSIMTTVIAVSGELGSAVVEKKEEDDEI
jgi:hypothetical protein